MKKLTTREFVSKARAVHGKKYSYRNVDYVNSNVAVSITCPTHGNFKQGTTRHLAGGGCPSCYNDRRSSTQRQDTSTFIEKAKSVHGDRYDYSRTKYLGAKSKVVITCSIHGDFAQEATSHVTGHGCPHCYRDKTVVRLTSNTDDFIRKARKVHGDIYSYEKTKYAGSKDYVSITCPEHGAFKQIPNNHLMGQACPKCFGSVSQGETWLAEWLRGQGEKVNASVRGKIRNPVTDRPLELDIYLPKHRIAIEYNGVYWHNESIKGRLYHQEKAKLCYDQGIRLIQLWDHDVNQKWPVVRSMIRQAIGKSHVRIYARSCSVESVDPSVAAQFFVRNHLKGNAGASVHLGLWFDDTLVSCMTFARPKFSNDHQWEIIRLASKRGYSVVGGASRLFTAFLRQYEPTSVMTYADLMTGTGAVYTELGMTQYGVTEPGYCWVFNGQLLPRYRAQKHKLSALLGTKFHSNLSERQNMERVGAYRVYDAGNAKFEWHSSSASI